ncbi:unnamed protein product [Trichobilharzia szidati]|nr:unnamed protein product [Trichobilharzia szidati]
MHVFSVSVHKSVRKDNSKPNRSSLLRLIEYHIYSELNIIKTLSVLASNMIHLKNDLHLRCYMKLQTYLHYTLRKVRDMENKTLHKSLLHDDISDIFPHKPDLYVPNLSNFTLTKS